MGKFFDFLGKIFGSDDKSVNIDPKTYRDNDPNSLALEAYAIFTAVETLSSLMANCEIKTFRNGKEEKGNLWYRLNYAPNVNQTATEFWREFYNKLLYEGEALCFETYDKQIISADSWNVTDMEIIERTFYDVTRGSFTAYGRFKISDVLYVKFENKNAMALRCGLLSRLSQLAASAADTYEQSGGSKVLLNIPASAKGMTGFEEDFKDLMENRFKSFFRSRNAVLPLWGNMQAAFRTESSADAKIKDISNIATEALTHAALAYKIAPALLTGKTDGLEKAIRYTLTTAADPLANVVSEQATVKFFSSREVIEDRCYAVVDTSNIMHTDIFDIAPNVEKLVSSGFMNIDDLRERAGLEPTGEDFGKKYFITKNFTEIDQALKEGENE